MDDPHHEYSEDGVDMTLIRWMLSLTVEERLRLLQDRVRFFEEARKAAEVE